MQKSAVIASVLLIAVLLVGGFFLFFNKNNSRDNLNPGSLGSLNSNSTQTGSGSSGTQATPKTQNITIKNSAFQAPLLTINAGDTVVWTNKDSSPHTVTSDSGSELNSPTLGGAYSGGGYSQPTSGGSYSHTFTTAGTYDYHCSIHTGMKGKIVVE